MMKIRKVWFVIIVLVSAVLFTGCINTETPVNLPPVPQQSAAGPAGITTSGVPVARQPSAAASTEVAATPPPGRIFNGEYRWAEYRINNTITLPPNPRYQWEYAARVERFCETYRGITAIHEKTSVYGDDSRWEGGILVTTKNGFHETEDRFFDLSTKRLLGGTRAGSGAGRDSYDEVVVAEGTSREDNFRGWLLISPFEEMNVPLSFQGTESVSVPAGTFPHARKYSGSLQNLSDFPVTFWVSDGVPVPVQYRISNPDLGGEDPIQTFELKDWG